MTTCIKRKENVEGFTTPQGETLYELSGRVIGNAHQHSLAQVEMEPGSASLKHYHPILEENYYILSGNARLELNEQILHLTVGDSVVIPAKASHQIFNDADQALSFLVVCAPSWMPEASVFE